jgi:hypothetical protein
MGSKPVCPKDSFSPMGKSDRRGKFRWNTFVFVSTLVCLLHWLRVIWSKTIWPTDIWSTQFEERLVNLSTVKVITAVFLHQARIVSAKYLSTKSLAKKHNVDQMFVGQIVFDRKAWNTVFLLPDMCYKAFYACNLIPG